MPGDWRDPEDPNYEPPAELEVPEPEPTGDASDFSFVDSVIDLFSGGAAFAVTRSLTSKAKARFGKHGAAVTSVAAFAASVEAAKRKKKGKAALVIGSGIATIQNLVELYSTKKPTLVSIEEFQQLVRDKKLAIRVKTKKISSPKFGRALVIRYVASEGDDSWYCDQARRITADGKVNLGGTLLSRLRKRSK